MDINTTDSTKQWEGIYYSYMQQVNLSNKMLSEKNSLRTIYSTIPIVQ